MKLIEIDSQQMTGLKSCLVSPEKSDYAYLATKTFGVNLAVRLAMAMSVVAPGHAEWFRVAALLVWYQAQDALFTLYGKSYLNVLSRMAEGFKISGARVGDVAFLYIQLSASEFVSRLLLGAVGDTPAVLSFAGIGFVLLNVLQGMVSAGPIVPAINQARRSGAISEKTSLHLYQLSGLTIHVGLLSTFGHQVLHAWLTGIVFVASWMFYFRFSTLRKNMTKAAPIAALLLALGAPLFAAPAPLSVIVVVDQMRADYLDRFSREFIGGFARMSQEGAVFTQARHGHIPTETAPGHATLLTGCFPGRHGIVANSWTNRKTGKSVYAVADDTFTVSPINLLCPTLGDELKAFSAKSRSVSVAGKDRSAILMGGHKADMALWYDQGSGRFVSNGYYPAAPGWVARWNDDLRIPADQRQSLTTTILLDAMTLELARKAVVEENLGGHGAPDLLTVSLSANDLIGHAKGPDSPEIHAHILALDREIGYFLQFLDEKFGRGGYAFVLSSDHGVQPVPETLNENKTPVGARVILADYAAELEKRLSDRLGKPPSAGQKWVLAAYPPNVYLNFGLAAEMGISTSVFRSEAAAALALSLAVAHVYYPEQLRGSGPFAGPFADVFARSYYPDRSGDLLILLKERVLIMGGPTGTSHGTPYDYDARIPLVFMGKGIRAGHYDSKVLSTDLMPTMERLMGLKTAVQEPSRSLNEALQ